MQGKEGEKGERKHQQRSECTDHEGGGERMTQMNSTKEQDVTNRDIHSGEMRQMRITKRRE